MELRPAVLLAAAALSLFALGASAQTAAGSPSTSDEQERIAKLEHRVAELESESGHVVGGAGFGLAVLFGAFCALWAQNTGRSPWLWFFLGLFLNVIAVVFLLGKNSQDVRTHREGRSTPPPGPQASPS